MDIKLLFRKTGLLSRIIVAIVLGIACGYVFPEFLSRIFITFNATFSQFLSFCVPLIIIGFVVTAISDIGGKAGKMLLFTTILAYAMTIFQDCCRILPVFLRFHIYFLTL